MAELKMITLDCVDPRRSTEFWHAILGWEVAYVDDDYGMLTGPAHALGFGRVADYEPPAWPNERGSKQFHLDLAVENLEDGADQAVAAGATRPAEQPGGGDWIVLLDPSGHPFCLTQAGRW